MGGNVDSTETENPEVQATPAPKRRVVQLTFQYPYTINFKKGNKIRQLWTE